MQVDINNLNDKIAAFHDFTSKPLPSVQNRNSMNVTISKNCKKDFCTCVHLKN